MQSKIIDIYIVVGGQNDEVLFEEVFRDRKEAEEFYALRNESHEGLTGYWSNFITQPTRIYQETLACLDSNTVPFDGKVHRILPDGRVVSKEGKKS